MNITRASKWRSLAAGGAACLAFCLAPAAPALAAVPVLSLSSSGVSVAGLAVAGSACATPQLSQPFLSWGDADWYTLAPGESSDDVNGAGWSLDLGARLTRQQLLDGSTGSVLDLPPGGVAISPPICVASNYPLARTMIRTTDGARLSVGVVYADTLAAGLTLDLLQSNLSGAVAGSSTWAPSATFEVNPGGEAGWQVVQFVFVNLSGGDAQLYDFYVDPRLRD